MNILLVCNAGMSTGIMRLKLEEEAKKRGVDAKVNAIPMVELEDHKEGTDAILLGPQIRFALDDIQKSAEGIPAMVIAPQDFGSMNAAKVFDEVLEMLS
ncbi:PTS sugar transporter subunit IIB [Anaerostipes sp.]|uniref:PTS sugar transporter subunit IIB n=1 Tax=Anaerostipes sp. TaxID=1872530 RepID=UPI0025BCE931|nr:PTS sugar transporter subunit IIB [Anaerostipes sp.]MBS7009445.1 PTS sugar transporter subunit IIB [Anaerostipes sp.]